MNTPSSLELAQIRTALIEERDALVAQVEVLNSDDDLLRGERRTPAERVRSAGDADMISVERSTLATQSRSVLQSVAEIDAALARIDAGTYGRCARCQADIPAPRLMARPKSTTCVPCASR